MSRLASLLEPCSMELHSRSRASLSSLSQSSRAKRIAV
jgi:hypothetical protein